jgi:hypothetical protein
MIEVTKDTFYKAIGGPENINPRADSPDHSTWINLATHQQVGKTTPGYKGSFGVPSRYYLTEAFAASKNIKEGT